MCVCVSEYLFMCICKKPSPPTPPQRQHKGECNTKIALKAGAETTTKKRTMRKSLTTKNNHKRGRGKKKEKKKTKRYICSTSLIIGG